MKKHRFKAGDVGYVLLDGEILPAIVTKTENKAELIEIFEESNCSEPFYVNYEYLHPTPEACAQALVDEFYFNNPET